MPETVTGPRTLSADIYGLASGCRWKSAGQAFLGHLSGGLALAEINSDFRFNETIRLGPATLPSAQGSGSHTDLLAGGYIEGNISYALNHSTGVFAGVQFQDLGKYTHSENGRDAVLDLSKSIFVTLGISYSF